VRYLILAIICVVGTPVYADISPIINLHKGTNLVKLFSGKGKLLAYRLPTKTIFIADPSIADFTVKSEGLLFIIPKKLGQTNLIGLDAENHILFNATIESSIDEFQTYTLMDRVAPGNRLRLKVFNDTVVLTGQVKYPADLDNVTNLLKQYLKGVNIQNMALVESPSQVYLKVRVMEVSRSITSKLGVYWDVAYQTANFGVSSNFGQGLLGNGGGIGGGGGSGGAGGGGGIPGLYINAFIDALVQKGLITILAEPNLTTLSGTQASFLAGGQFPIPVPQTMGVNTIQYQNYGATLAFTPTIIDKSLINLAINTTVSSLSNTGATQSQGYSIPGLSTRNANVTVQLHSGESIAIGGLLQKEMHKAIDKYPGLAELPILGRLFTSKGFSNHESELVIVVTPYLVNPVGGQLASPADSFPSQESKLVPIKPLVQAKKQTIAKRPRLIFEEK
jgi:pilus assembly protein CpaC